MDKPESADRWLAAVRDQIYDRSTEAGIDAWIADPQARVTRERAARLLVLAVKRRDRARTRS